jgi:hypothetical protein
MYSLVSLLTHVYMYLSKHFLYECLEVFQLEALSCYSSKPIGYLFISLPNLNFEEVVVISRENSKIFTYKKVGRYSLEAVQMFKLYDFFLAFQRHQFHLNPILKQRVMIKTLRRVQKSSWKPEKRLDGVALPSGRLLFPDLCLNMKSNSK